MRAWSVAAALWLGWLSAGCASQPISPFFNDAAYLRFGLDPNAEASAEIKAHGERGEPLALRIDSPNFTALGFMQRSGRSTRVRVLTRRGIQLALDPEPGTALTPEVRYALLAPVFDTTNDIDGDGFDEVLVERHTPDATCLLVYRVRDVGFVDPVPTTVHLFGRGYCPQRVADIDGNGRAELLLDAALEGFDGVAPRLRIALWAADHRFEPRGDRQALERYARAQRARRAQALSEARHRADLTQARRLGIELAAIEHVLGRPPAAQVAAYDKALLGLVLSTDQQRRLMADRATIFSAWNAPPAATGSDAATARAAHPAAKAEHSGARSPAKQSSPARPPAKELVNHAGP